MSNCLTIEQAAVEEEKETINYTRSRYFWW